MRNIPFYIKPAKQGDLVDLVTIEMESFPANSSIFHHDFDRMGTSLTHHEIVMTGSPRKGDMLSDVIYANQATGQRWRLVPVSRDPSYYDYVYLGSEKDCPASASGAVYTLDLTDKGKVTLTAVKMSDANTYKLTPAGKFLEPKYFCYNNHAILLSSLMYVDRARVIASVDACYCEFPESVVDKALDLFCIYRD